MWFKNTTLWFKNTTFLIKNTTLWFENTTFWFENTTCNLKIQVSDLKIQHFELKIQHYDLKMQHCDLNIQHFELKILHFDLKIQHCNLGTKLFLRIRRWVFEDLATNFLLFIFVTCVAFIAVTLVNSLWPSVGCSSRKMKNWAALSAVVNWLNWKAILHCKETLPKSLKNHNLVSKLF